MNSVALALAALYIRHRRSCPDCGRGAKEPRHFDARRCAHGARLATAYVLMLRDERAPMRAVPDDTQ